VALRIDLVGTTADFRHSLELAEVMKKEFPEVPILLTSGYGDVTGNAVARGFHVIPKPYRMEELRMRLGELLNTRST